MSDTTQNKDEQLEDIEDLVVTTEAESGGWLLTHEATDSRIIARTEEKVIDDFNEPVDVSPVFDQEPDFIPADDFDYDELDEDDNQYLYSYLTNPDNDRPNAGVVPVGVWECEDVVMASIYHRDDSGPDVKNIGYGDNWEEAVSEFNWMMANDERVLKEVSEGKFKQWNVYELEE